MQVHLMASRLNIPAMRRSDRPGSVSLLGFRHLAVYISYVECDRGGRISRMAAHECHFTRFIVQKLIMEGNARFC